jgi:hypothetical protein
VLADDEQNLFRENLLVKRGEVELCLNSLIVDEQAITQTLAKKPGQLLFLQNSLKVNNQLFLINQIQCKLFTNLKTQFF